MVIDSCGRLFVASAANSRVDIFGLPGHADPEAFAPGRLEVSNQPIDPRTDTQLVAYLELPGYRLSSVSDIQANGFAVPQDTSIGDVDGDNIPDLRIVFGSNLVSTLFGTSQATIAVTGTVAALGFDESDIVQVVPINLDSDGDGVADSVDACPDTTPGAIAGTDGCSVDQRCACEGPVAGVEWTNHGEYVACVVSVADEFVDAGVIQPRQRGSITRLAARGSCGKPVKAKGRGKR